MGEGNAKWVKNDNKYIFQLNACPYKKAEGFPITEMSFFCDYTHGLIEASIRKAFPSQKFSISTDQLISNKCESCVFTLHF